MRAATLLLISCVVLAAAGCSSGPEDQPVRSVTARAGEPVRIAADEYRFDPNRIVVKRAGRGAATLRIVLANRGSLAHNLHVRDGDRDLGSIQSFRPGEERSLSVRLQTGSYRFVCTVADHEELGMVGEIEVR